MDISSRILRFFKLIYLKLFKINDTPQKIAVGLGLGVFFGTMPGMGPLAALFFAFILRVNRAGALLGSLLTNTWLSIPTFLVSVKVGSIVTGMSYKDIHEGWHSLIKNFKWAALFELSGYKIILPVVAGYIIVSFVIGFLAYIIALALFTYSKKKC